MNVPLLWSIGFFMLLALGGVVYAVAGIGTEDRPSITKLGASSPECS